jgi:hypothetical protein
MKLQRLSQTPAVTLGRFLTDKGEEICKTLELPWRNNATGISCIPAGSYTARRRYSPDNQCDVFEIANVDGRQNIEIHHGNTVRDTKGCILVGMRFDDLMGISAVMNSDVAFARLMTVMRGIDLFPIDVLDIDAALKASA